MSSQQQERQWCDVAMSGGPYPVVTQLWLYDGDEDDNPIYHEFGLSPKEARHLARNLNRAAREATERGL